MAEFVVKPNAPVVWYHCNWDTNDPVVHSRAVEHMIKRAKEGNRVAQDWLDTQGIEWRDNG